MGDHWTDTMDAVLLKGRDAEPPVGWKRLVLDIAPGMTRQRAERRYRLLKGASPDEGQRRVDGLLWLLERKRLGGVRGAMALRYREMFRDAGGVSIKSSANVGAGGGAPGPGLHAEAAMVSHTQAQRDLFRVRWVVLRGQVDMLTVLDGVCGIGHTLRQLAGGNDRRAGELEAVLKVALDLIGDEFEGVSKKVA